MYFVHCDASIEPANPNGLIAWAFIVRKDGKIIHKDAATSFSGERASNNVGEAQAIIAALLWLIKLPKDQRYPVIINSDSQLIVNQCSERWQCNDEKLVPLRNLVLKAVKSYGKPVTFNWIPREQNEEADTLARSVYDPQEIELLRRKLNNKLLYDDIDEDDQISW